jgi:nucleoside-diphosphate-sugar epimerase
MNIVVIGGGTPGKFGNDVVKLARSQGHRVLVLSHRNKGDDLDKLVTNFSNVDIVVNDFYELVNDIDNIDILLYNTNCGGWPDSAENFKSTGRIKESLYIHGFKIHVVIPHALVLAAMSKMCSESRVVFVTTDMIYDREREKYLDKLGYAGGKSYQHQLMLALAEHNDKEITVSSISPFFDYNEPAQYKIVFKKAYEYLLTHSKESNGKVYDCWD